MKIYPGTTSDQEFANLRGLGYTGSLVDMQFAALRAEPLMNALPDMFKAFDGTLGGPAPFVSWPITISGLNDLGDGVFVVQIGSVLTAVSCGVTGATITGSTWQWLRDGVPIALATNQTYTPIAGDDLTAISVQQTLTLSAGSLAPVTSITFPVQYAAPTLVGSLTSQNFTTSTGVQTYATAGAFSATTGIYTISPTVTGVTIAPATGLVSVNTATTGPLAGVAFSINKTNSGGSASTGFLVSVSTDTADNRVLRPDATGTNYLRQDLATTAGSGTSTGDIMLTALVYLEAGETFVDGDILSIGNTTDANAWLGLGMKRAVMSNSASPATTTPDLADPVGPGWYVVSFVADSDLRRYRILRNAENAINSGTLSTTNYNAWSNKTTKYLSVGARVRGATPTVSNQFRHRIAGIMWVRGTGLNTTFATRAQQLHDWIYNAGNPRNPSSAILADFGMASDGTGETKVGALLPDGITPDNRLPFFRFSRFGAATFAPGEAAALDIRGPLDTWTMTGTMTWDVPGPPWPVGASVASLTSAAIPSGATNTLTLVATLPTGINWSATRTINPALIDVWSDRGPGGNPYAVSATSTATAEVCTVTVTLARPLYVGENVFVSLTANWLTDTNANGTIPTDSTVVTNNSPTAWPANWTGFSLRRIARTWTNAVPAQFPRGIGDVVQVQSGLGALINVYPALGNGTPQSHVRHGQMLNPTRGGSNHPQSFIFNAGLITSFNAGLEAPTNVSLVAGDVLVCTRSNLDKYTNGGDAVGPKPLYILQAVAVECVSAIPGANQLPGQIMAPGSGFSKPAPTSFDETLLTFPNNAYTGVTWPSPDVILNHLKVLDLGTLMFQNTIYKRQLTVSGLTNIDGYGQTKEPILGIAVAMLSGPTATIPLAKKRELARALYFRGEQKWNTFKTTGLGLLTDGAHTWGETADVVLYLIWSGKTAEWPNLVNTIGGNMLRSFFFLTNSHITAFNTPHTDVGTTAPQFNRANSIATVVSPTQFVLSFNPYGKDIYTGNLMYICPGLAPGGEGRQVTGWNATTRTITVASAFTVTPTVGDLCSWRSQHTQTVGSVDWNQKGASELPFVGTTWQGYSPAAAAEYRVQATTYGELFGLSALGYRPSVLAPAWEYMLLAMQTAQPLASNDFPGTANNYLSFNTEAELFANHHAAMVATAQTVG